MSAVFESTASFLLFDYFRVPYRVVASDGAFGLHACRTLGEKPRRALYWPAFDPEPTECEGPFALGGISFHGRLLDDDEARARLHAMGGEWTPVEPLHDDAGRHVASVWRSADRDVFLPFDPREAIETFWSEAYERSTGRAAKRAALRMYYLVRPLLPRRLQIALRRLLARVQAKRRFPRWPLESSLHDLYDLLFGYLADVARGPIPGVSCWPHGYSWALVLTHDVETAAGYRQLGTLAAVERELGYRSSWNFVPKRYEVEDELVRSLWDEGFEVGVHGLYHDGRDLESKTMLAARLPEIETYRDRWGAAGFRSPATHRDPELMALLPFAYDSSAPDSDPFEPRSGGCCSLLPFHFDSVVELPITLPQDHTLFAILREERALWGVKSTEIRRRGGMALVITHPDYMDAPERLGAYRELLAAFADDETAWRTLPRDVADWWNRRANSGLALEDGEWTVVGPAATEATVAWYGAQRDAGEPSRRALEPLGEEAA